MIMNPNAGGGGGTAKMVSGTLSNLSFGATWHVVYMAGENQYRDERIKGGVPFSVLANTLLWANSTEDVANIVGEGGAERIAYHYSNDGVFWITDDFTIRAE